LPTTPNVFGSNLLILQQNFQNFPLFSLKSIPSAVDSVDIIAAFQQPGYF
jgi:hypothetical protein